MRRRRGTDEYPHGRRDRLEYRLQRGRELARGVRRLDYAHCGNCEAVPVGGCGFVARVEVAHDSEDFGERRQVLETGLGEWSSGFVGGGGEFARDLQGDVVEMGLGSIDQDAECNLVSVGVHEAINFEVLPRARSHYGPCLHVVEEAHHAAGPVDAQPQAGVPAFLDIHCRTVADQLAAIWLRAEHLHEIAGWGTG